MSSNKIGTSAAVARKDDSLTDKGSRFVSEDSVDLIFKPHPIKKTLTWKLAQKPMLKLKPHKRTCIGNLSKRPWFWEYRSPGPGACCLLVSSSTTNAQGWAFFEPETKQLDLSSGWNPLDLESAPSGCGTHHKQPSLWHRKWPSTLSGGVNKTCSLGATARIKTLQLTTSPFAARAGWCFFGTLQKCPWQVISHRMHGRDVMWWYPPSKNHGTQTSFT